MDHSPIAHLLPGPAAKVTRRLAIRDCLALRGVSRRMRAHFASDVWTLLYPKSGNNRGDTTLPIFRRPRAMATTSCCQPGKDASLVDACHVWCAGPRTWLLGLPWTPSPSQKCWKRRLRTLTRWRPRRSGRHFHRGAPFGRWMRRRLQLPSWRRAPLPMSFVVADCELPRGERWWIFLLLGQQQSCTAACRGAAFPFATPAGSSGRRVVGRCA